MFYIWKFCEYYIKADYEFTAVEIQKYLLNKFEILLPQKLIREIIKTDLNLTYKRCSLRSNCAKFDKVNSLWWRFAANHLIS